MTDSAPRRDLEAELEAKAAELRLLQRVSSEINSTLEVEAIFEIVLDTMNELFGFEHALILLLDPSGTTLTVAASRGYDDPAIGRQVPLGTGVLGVVAKKRRMMLINNLGQRRAYASAIRRQMDPDDGKDAPAPSPLPGLPDVESQIAIPLLVKDHLIGVFSVESSKPRIFAERDEVLITIVANQAASAMHTARLYQAEALQRSQLAEAHDELEKLAASLEERVRERTRELEEANRELRDAQSQLVQSAKLASVGILASGVAHEINNPIASMASSRQVLGDALEKVRKTIEQAGGMGPDPRTIPLFQVIEESLDVIASGTDRISEYVSRLRSFTRLDQATLQRADIHEGLRSTIALIDHELGEDVRLRTEFGELPRVFCNPGHLNQVFLELLMNACQAISGEGEIVLRTAREGDRVLISISDTGSGIPPENLSRIFDPGFTTKDQRVGTSLGLPIAARIIDAHRGEIRVDSSLGQGTTFTISLPVDFSAAR